MENDFREILERIKSGEFKKIGNGSCRHVYDMKNGYVVKVAKDIRGIEQNLNEKNIFNTRKSYFFADIVSVSPDNKLLIMAKAKKIKKMKTVYKYYKVSNINSLLKVNNFIEDINIHKLSKGDIVKASSWGFVNQVPVLIDYGLTHNTFVKFYNHSFIFGKKYSVIRYW